MIARAAVVSAGVMVLAAATAAQTARTVWDGVYSEEQATRGATLDADRCARCHGDGLGGVESAPALTGTASSSNREGETLESLFERMRSSMPADKPGSLSRAQNADVLAHMLKVSGYLGRGHGALRAGGSAHDDRHPDVQTVTRGHGLDSEKDAPLATTRTRRTTTLILASTAALALSTTPVVQGQSGAARGEWPHATAATSEPTRYAPLDQIPAANFRSLKVKWRFKTDNLGPRPEFNLESTPLMVGGRLYSTAGTRKSVIALDAATGELIRVHGENEGARGQAAPRQLSGCEARRLDRRPRGNASSTSRPVIGWWRSTRRRAIPWRASAAAASSIPRRASTTRSSIPLNAPVGLHATPIVGGNFVLVGAAFETGANPRSRANVRGAVRAYSMRGQTSGVDVPHHPAGRRVRQRDVGERLVGGTSGTPACVGAEHRWTKSSAWPIVLPVELPTHDYYGGARPGNTLFAESLVAVDLLQDRCAQVAFPARAPRRVGHGHPARASIPRGYRRQRPALPSKPSRNPASRGSCTSSIA